MLKNNKKEPNSPQTNEMSINENNAALDDKASASTLDQPLNISTYSSTNFLKPLISLRRKEDCLHKRIIIFAPQRDEARNSNQELISKIDILKRSLRMKEDFHSYCKSSKGNTTRPDQKGGIETKESRFEGMTSASF